MEGRERAPQFDLPHWIEELAAVAAAKGDTLRAATLWGATDGLFERFGLATLEENRQVRALYRDGMGGSLDGDSHAEARAQGHAMTLQQADRLCAQRGHAVTGGGSPSQRVTLVVTDIEGSTRLLGELGTAGYREALGEHRRIMRAAG